MFFGSIVAIDKNRGFSYQGEIPWKPSAVDMKIFKEITSGGAVVMGRKTWEGIPAKRRPLSGRLNIVITSKPFVCSTVRCVPSLEKAIEIVADSKVPSCYFIGGEQIYQETMDLCTNFIVMTYFGYDGPTDRKYPQVPLHAKLIKSTVYEGENFRYDFFSKDPDFYN